MDVIDDRIIDVGLNVIGFIAAGLFWMVVYTAITRNRKARTVAGNDVQASLPDLAAAEKQKAEFIDLNSMPARYDSVNTIPSPAISANRADTRRDRLEIIQIAREMIKKGASDEKIRNALPISKGELALLSGSNRR